MKHFLIMVLVLTVVVTVFYKLIDAPLTKALGFQNA